MIVKGFAEGWSLCLWLATTSSTRTVSICYLHSGPSCCSLHWSGHGPVEIWYLLYLLISWWRYKQFFSLSPPLTFLPWCHFSISCSLFKNIFVLLENWIHIYVCEGKIIDCKNIYKGENVTDFTDFEFLEINVVFFHSILCLLDLVSVSHFSCTLTQITFAMALTFKCARGHWSVLKRCLCLPPWGVWLELLFCGYLPLFVT